MNGRFLALALGLTAMTVFGSNMASAQTPAPETPATAKGAADGAPKAEHAGKHKEHGKKSGEHEKAHQEKGEAKEPK